MKLHELVALELALSTISCVELVVGRRFEHSDALAGGQLLLQLLQLEAVGFFAHA